MEEKKKKIISKRSIKFQPKKSVLIEKRLEQKTKLIPKLESLLSKPCSQYGYTADILSTLEELSITQNDFFQICLSCLSKTARKKEETNLIFGYLYLMNDFVSMLNKNNGTHVFEDLQLIAKNLGYEKLPESHILMRLGEKGKKAYITLNGNIDILIKTSKEMKVLEKDYLYYIANLIRWKEYGLVNIVINDNFQIFPLEIIDDITQKDITQKDNDKINNTNNYENETISSERKSIIEIEVSNNENNIKQEKDKDNDKDNFSYFKLNPQNQLLKDPQKTKMYKASNLLSLFKLKLSDKKNEKEINNVSTENYINRLNVCRDYTNIEIPLNKIGLENFYNLKIYSYIKIISRTTGSLFGEIALSDPQALRTATIITTSESHFGTLNKKSYNQSLKSGAEKQQRQTVVFLTNFPVFNSFPIVTFFKRYFTFFSEKNPIKGSFIYCQDDKPNFFALLREGSYEVTSKMNLKELSNLIAYLLNKSNTDECQNKLNDLINNEREIYHIMKENAKFKAFYYKKEVFRISEIQSPEFIGFDDFINSKGKITFTVECKSPKGQFYTLSYDFYKEMKNKEYSIRSNEVFMKKNKMDVMIKRLLIIRNSLIKSFFDYKMERNPIEKKLKENFREELLKERSAKRLFESKKIIFRKDLLNLFQKQISLNSKEKNIITERTKKNSQEKQKDKKTLTSQNFRSSKLPNSKKMKRVIKLQDKKHLRIKTDSNKLLRIREQILLPGYFSPKEKIKQLLQNKYSIYREINYFSDNDNTSDIYNSNEIKSIENETTNNKTYYNNTDNTFISQNKENELISQGKKPPKIMMNDMVWENVKPKMKFPIFQQLSFSKIKNNKLYIPHSRNFNININPGSQTPNNNSNSINYFFNNTHGNFHQGKFYRKEINIIRENNTSKNVVDIYGYSNLKKQKYSFDRIKKLILSNNRLQNMFGGHFKK